MTSEYADLAGQVALITGGAGAIGRAISEGLIGVGAKVALVDIAEERLQSYGEKLASKAGSGRVLTIVADVCDSRQVRRAFDLTLEEFGRLDILVNNAAATQIMAVDLLSDEDIDLIIDTNLKGYVKCAREAVKIMKASDTKGTLLFISSKNGLEGAANKSLYCATKGGELAMARSLAKELGPFGITVNAIAPGMVATALNRKLQKKGSPFISTALAGTPTGRLTTPEQIAELVVFLSSAAGANINGETIRVDGGAAINIGMDWFLRNFLLEKGTCLKPAYSGAG